MPKGIISRVMLTLLLIGMLTLTFNTQPVKASETIHVSADGIINPRAHTPVSVKVIPETVSCGCHEEFTIQVVVEDVADLYGLDVHLGWNTTFLSYINHIAKIPVEDYPDGILHEPAMMIKDEVDTGAGTYWIAHASMYPAAPFDGNGTVFEMTFQAKTNGIGVLEIFSSDLGNSLGTPIPHNVVNGTVEILSTYALTIYSSPTGVTFTVDGASCATPWSKTYLEGTLVDLMMPFTYTAGDAKYYWNQWSDAVTSRSRTITMNEDITLTGEYTGPYYKLTVTSSPITGIAFTVNDEEKTTPYSEWLPEDFYNLEMPETHNEYVWYYWLEDGDTNRVKTIYLQSTTWTGVYRLASGHDVAVTNVTLAKTVVGQDYTAEFNVTVENQGDYSETFNVIAYANESIIQTKTITLSNRTSTTATFTWNTTGVAKGNYTITAYATPVLGETDTRDNTLVDGWVFVSIPGDVDGDKDIDIYDVVKITDVYRSENGDLEYKPNSDINGDGIINIYDVVICTSHYGQSWQP